MQENLSFGYWVRRRRRALDLTQAELGRRAGASAAMIRKIETDERRPSRELAASLAEQLAVPPTEREQFIRAARHPLSVAALAPAVADRANPAAPFPALSALPAPLTSLINRTRDLAAVAELLRGDAVRLLTILGPPGIGKTRLSIQSAKELWPHFGDGVYFVDLSQTLDGELFLPAIAQTLELAPQPAVPPLQRLVAALRDKQALLVLDNVEQIVAQAGPETAVLLRACPGLKVLATSRVRLDVYGEHEYALPPLTLPPREGADTPGELEAYEAVQLFLARVRQVRPGFLLTTENAAPVAEICRRMDGLPLALELAAAGLRRFTLPQLAAALDEASGREWDALLHTTARDLPARQQTMFRSIAWSYSLLEAGPRSLLAALGVFPGAFDWPAVAALEPANTSLRQEFDLLVDYNLVSRESRLPERWRLLEAVREFALDRQEPERAAAVRQRFMRYTAALLLRLYEDSSDRTFVDALAAEMPNGRAALAVALDLGDTLVAHQLVSTLQPYWERRGLLAEGRRALAAVLALPGEVHPALLLGNLHDAATMAFMQYDLPAAQEYAAAALAVALREQRADFVATLANLRGRILIVQGHYRQADAVLQGAVVAGQPLTPQLEQAAGFALVQRGEAALALGELDRAQELTRQGLRLLPPDNVIAFAMGWTNLAELSLTRGAVPDALAALRQALPVASLHLRRLRLFLVAAAGYLLAAGPAQPANAAAAVQLLGFVTESSRTAGDPLPPAVQDALAERLSAARALLSEEGYAAAWKQGSRLSAEEAAQVAARSLPA